LYSSPTAKGTFALSQIREVLDEATKIGTVNMIFFEGGEAFLYYPLMVEGIKMACDKGFATGIVTNGYFATTEEDAEIWLKPLKEMGLANLSISNDPLHYGDEKDNPARHTFSAAQKLGISTGEISIEEPSVIQGTDEGQNKGEPVIGGSTMLRGRAVEKLSEGLPTKNWEDFIECPFEELGSPKRVHLDPYGNVHICQGLSMGNMWETPLSEIVSGYDGDSHPICGPMIRGGPAQLARELEAEHEEEYISACHFCYLLRLGLIDKFPQYLAPRQVYGFE